MSFVSPPLPPPPSETRFYFHAVTSPTPLSSGETSYESPRRNKDSWGCCSGFALRAPSKCKIFCFRLIHWLDQSQCNISICQLLQNDQECYWTLVKTKKRTRTYNKELCSAGILKIIKLLFFFSEMSQGAKRKIKFKISQPWNTLWILLLSPLYLKYFICFLNVLQLQSNQDKNQLKLTDKSFN